MGAKYQNGAGFTIVETVLFIAISGLLAILLMTGWTAMINAQRYKDSVYTLQSFLQQQYNLVYSTENARPNTLVCSYNPSGPTYTLTEVPTSTTMRGQSDCLVMGRYITLENGKDVRVRSIIGHEPSAVTSKNDNEVIDLYDPKQIDEKIGLSNSELDIPWNANIVIGGGNTTVQQYAIAIIRAPITGVVHTYVVPVSGSFPDVKDMVDDANENKDTNLCLDPDTLFVGGGRGIVLKAYASTQSAVQTISGGACA